MATSGAEPAANSRERLFSARLIFQREVKSVQGRERSKPVRSSGVNGKPAWGTSVASRRVAWP